MLILESDRMPTFVSVPHYPRFRLQQIKLSCSITCIVLTHSQVIFIKFHLMFGRPECIIDQINPIRVVDSFRS